MKRIVSDNNYVQLEEFNTYTNSYVLQLGFALSGLTYKIENRNVKFYLKEDYFYKNSVWSADLPLEIDGTTYTQEDIAEGLAALFGQSEGGGSDLSNYYTKGEVDSMVGTIADDFDDLNTEIEAINAELDSFDAQMAEKAEKSALEALSQQVATNTSSIAEKAPQSELDALSENLADNYYTKGEVDGKFGDYYNKTEVDQAIDEAIAGGGADLSNYYTKTEVDNKLGDYYTKTESDAKFQVKFTDVDDIRMVSSLPANPDSRTLYLIPVE